MAPAPLTPLAVKVVVALAHIGLAAAVAEVIAGMANFTVKLPNTAQSHVPELLFAKTLIVGAVEPDFQLVMLLN